MRLGELSVKKIIIFLRALLCTASGRRHEIFHRYCSEYLSPPRAGFSRAEVLKRQGWIIKFASCGFCALHCAQLSIAEFSGVFVILVRAILVSRSMGCNCRLCAKCEIAASKTASCFKPFTRICLYRFIPSTMTPLYISSDQTKHLFLLLFHI